MIGPVGALNVNLFYRVQQNEQGVREFELC
jgi:hypothetical protein